MGTAGSAGGSTSTIAGNTFANGGVTSGTSICNVWTWAQLGVMGLLFLIIALTEVSFVFIGPQLMRDFLVHGHGGKVLTIICWQAYFLMYQGIYASEQRLDQ